VRDRIAAAARKAGRDPGDVRLMAVTKGFPRETVEAALNAGIGLFGENRVQEAQLKFAGLSGTWELHLIGICRGTRPALRQVLFSCVQSIDSADTAVALNRCCAERGRAMDVLLEINTSGEQSKAGVRGGRRCCGFSMPARSCSGCGEGSDDGRPSQRGPRVGPAFVRRLRAAFEEARACPRALLLMCFQWACRATTR